MSASSSAILTCRKCSKEYRKRRATEEHAAVCESPERDRSVLTRGAVEKELLHSQDLCVKT